MSAPLSSSDALRQGWLGSKALAEAFGCDLRTLRRYADLHEFPPSIGQIKPENGRPETAWRVSDLPATLLVRGKTVALRGPAEKALYDALHALAPASTALIAVPLGAVPAAPKPPRDLPPGAIYGRGMVRRAQGEEHYDDQEREARDAALILCRAVEAAQAATDCRVSRACAELAARLVAGDARPELLAAAHATYLKPRPANGPLGGVSAQAARLEKMMKFYEAGRKTGDVAAFLVPGKRHKEGHDPAHIAAFLRFYCQPSRPPVSEAHRAMIPFLQERGLTAPSYSVAVRIERALPVTIKYRGRITGSEWRSLRPYVERDVSMFHSNDIWVGDGHSFKAKVAHPIHGQPFTPEITFILDWVSRKIVGWSIALSESTIAVSDAFRHAQLTTRARPLVYYSDNGSGQTGKMIDHPIAGTLARQGIGHETGIPGNPQARGIIERLWQVTLIRLARTYPTCTWKQADEHTVNKMLKALNKKDGGGVQLPAFLTLTADVKQCVNDYNFHHPHRELDGAAPEQIYQDKLDKDSIVFGPNDGEINALWMPETIRIPQRGKVALWGNQYFLKTLPDLLPEGVSVRVRYDLHNADQVWLRTLDGKYLGVAQWNGHVKAAFPVPEIDRKRAERATRRSQRGEKIIAEAQAELGEVIEIQPLVRAPIERPDYLPTGVERDEDDELIPFSETVREFYGNRKEENDEEDDKKEAASR